MITFTPEKFWLPAYVLSRQMRRVKGREYSTHSVSEGAHRPQIRRLTSRFAKQRNRSAENQATAFRTTQSNTQLIKRMKSLYSSLIEGGSPPAIVVNGVSHKVTLRSRRTGPADAATLALSVISSRSRKPFIRSTSFCFGTSASSQLSTNPAASAIRIRRDPPSRGSSVLR